MTTTQLVQQLGWELLTPTAPEREITKVYCCDLLSWVMGRAPADSAWVTVMGNVNAVAVAALADVACIVLAEGAVLDEQAQQKAQQNEIVVLRSGEPVYETAVKIAQECKL
ncbi:MAG: hypothetical protein HFG20_07840 [Anaerotruncus sp.]|jgi:Na+/serine symporter|nr:hypothetical protein [Anaerotruncus sp.]